MCRLPLTIKRDDESKAPAERGLSDHAASIRAMQRRFSMTLVDVATGLEPAGVRCHTGRADGLQREGHEGSKGEEENRK